MADVESLERREEADFDVTMSRIEEAERNVAQLYAVGYQLYNRGMLSEKIRSSIHQARDAVYHVELLTYNTILVALRAIASGILALTPLATVNWSAMLPRVPRPKKRRDLPAANLGAPPAVPLDVASAWRPAYGRADTAAGTSTTYLWVVGVVAILVIGAGATIVAVVGLDRWMRVQTFAIEAAAETTRYLAQLQDTAARYFDCLDRGGAIAQCVEQFPTPEPPVVHGAPAGIPWGWMVGGALAAAGGWFFFRSEPGRALIERLSGEQEQEEED